MNFNITLSGLEDVLVTKSEVQDNGVIEITVEIPLIPHICPRCGEDTEKVHDYRIQSVRHLKMATTNAFQKNGTNKSRYGPSKQRHSQKSRLNIIPLSVPSSAGLMPLSRMP